jgi:hypothetical protein
MLLNGFWESLEVASAVSRLNQTLTHQFEAWRERPRPRALARGVRRTLIHCKIRHGSRLLAPEHPNFLRCSLERLNGLLEEA